MTRGVAQGGLLEVADGPALEEVVGRAQAVLEPQLAIDRVERHAATELAVARGLALQQHPAGGAAEGREDAERTRGQGQLELEEEGDQPPDHQQHEGGEEQARRRPQGGAQRAQTALLLQLRARALRQGVESFTQLAQLIGHWSTSPSGSSGVCASAPSVSPVKGLRR